MQPLAETIIAVVSRRVGISDSDLAFAIYGRRVQQLVNGECNHLANGRRIERHPRPDGVIGNYPAGANSQ